MKKHESQPDRPSAWVARFAGLIDAGGTTLDLACGGGRNVRYLLGCDFTVTAVDVDVSGLDDLRANPKVEILRADLEAEPWPLGGRRFAGVIVTNYLHRPLFPRILSAVAPGGLLIYETFAAGNERFGRPCNPNYLLKRGELLEVVRGTLTVIAYEDIEVSEPRPAAVQRIAAKSP